MTRLSDNFDLSWYGRFPDGPLIERIEGSNLDGEPTTALVYRLEGDLSDFWADGNEKIEVPDDEPVLYSVQFIAGAEPKGESPLEFGENGLVQLRSILAR